MHLYDALSYDKTLPSHRILSPDELRRVEPSLDSSRFHGAALFYDCQCASPERLTLENAIDASEHGALIQNYTEVVGAIHEDGRLAGVRVKKVLEGGPERELRGRIIVNASGPWFDRVAARLESTPAPRLRTTKGVHIACESFTNHAIFLESAVDGRAVFAIPWMGHTWIGTTDTDFDDDPATASATDEDVRYLIESLALAAPAAAHREAALDDRRRPRARALGRLAVRGQPHASHHDRDVGPRLGARRQADGIPRHRRGGRRPRLPRAPGVRAFDDGHDAAAGRRSGAIGRAASRRDLRVAGAPGPGARRRGSRTRPPAGPGASGHRGRSRVLRPTRVVRSVEDFLLRRSYLGFQPDRGESARRRIDAALTAVGPQA